MANTKQIRTKIKSVKNLQKIIKALEIVSTVKLQKLKGVIGSYRAFGKFFGGAKRGEKGSKYL